jgi:hypothetical protein
VKRPPISKRDADKFGRHLSLLFTRATMYKPDHPYVKQAADTFYQVADKLLQSVSPLVFSMNRKQIFVDEEMLDPRVNVARVISYFESNGIQSISLYTGMRKDELEAFLEVYVAASKYPNIQAMNSALIEKNINNLKINYVFFTKMTVDETVTARKTGGALGATLPKVDDQSSRKLFYNMLLEEAMVDELRKNLSVTNLLRNPVGVSQNMIRLDVKSQDESNPNGRGSGPILLNQLQMLGDQVEKAVKGEAGIGLPELAPAVFALRRQLLEGMELQKSLGTIYADEENIHGKTDEIADNVLMQLVRDEYRAGNISAARLAQILRRLIPERHELKRVLPKIKQALLDEGMPAGEYWSLVRELEKELESDELARVLHDSSKEAGVDDKDLIREIKRNPVQVAELICLAAEIQKGSGDPKVLTDVLVDYVERLGPQLALDSASGSKTDDRQHLRQVIAELEASIVKQLKSKDASDHVIAELEERINRRLDTMFEKFSSNLPRQEAPSATDDREINLTLLHMVEQNVGNNVELREVLRAVRAKMHAERIDENDFPRIYAEINKQIQARRQEKSKRRTRPGLLQPRGVMFLFRKEMARAKRYNQPFSVLCFSAVEAHAQNLAPARGVTDQAVVEAVLNKLAIILREADVLGQLEQGRMVALLPMTEAQQARVVLRRCLKVLRTEPVLVAGVPLTLKMAGVVHGFDPSTKPDVDAFIQAMANELEHMISRVKNINMFL